MSMLQPSSCKGYQLKLPQIPQSPEYAQLDQHSRKKLSLDCRTGAAVNLSRANLFVHGGLTIPLNIENITILTLQKELIIYFSKTNNNKNNFGNLNQWISSEIFFLDLVSRTWHHMETTMDDSETNENLEIQNDLLSNDIQNGSLESPMKGRLFHSLCYFGSAVYIFGGLVVSPHTGYELIATNELWKLDLKTRKWSLISNDPRINRRYSHSMHVKNENVDTRDTKLIIIGGTNNISEPVTRIDVYNLTKGCWQIDVLPKEDCNFIVNIDNKPIPLSVENTFSILVENNEAKIPALVVYNPNNQFEQDHEMSDSSYNKDSDLTKDTTSKLDKEKMVSPMTTLPLISDSKGMRLAYNNLQTPDILRESFNLQFPSGQYFGYNIIIGGFYPNCNPENYCCFVYDIPSGRWTRVSIRGPDSDIVQRRYWKLFVWKTHHQTILLGTNNNDKNLPSVQKFDHLLVFGLPLINAFNKIMTPTYFNKLKSGSLTLNSFQNALDDSIKQQLVFGTDESPMTRNSSYASGVTSQFENYIKYIAPSFELSSIKSTFPPFAVVLGKDSLEVYGDAISDFEFITSEGDTVKVPMYLLRKRWGRYFDFLLSQGYSKICLENELNVKRSMLIKYTPISSRITSRASSRQEFIDYFRDSARSSMSKPSNRESPRASNMLERTTSGPHKSLSQLFINDVDDPSKYPRLKYSTRLPFAERTTMEEQIPILPPKEEALDINDPVSPPPDELLLTDKTNDKDTYSNNSNAIKRTGTTSTTSSTTGMVFRVPFQESKNTSNITVSPFHKSMEQRRRSSLMDLPTNIGDEIRTSRRNSAFKRRASHPMNNVTFQDNLTPSQKVNRKLIAKFPNSARSSLSFASSTSERKRNSLPSLKQRSKSPENSLDIMTVDLPPTTKSPDEPLPEVPIIKFGNNRRPSASIYDFAVSNKGSPFSSRRASFVSASSNPDWKEIGSSMNNLTLDEKLLQKNEELNRAQQNETNNRQSLSQPRSRMFSKNSTSGENSLSNIPSLSDRTRPSIASFSESNDSILSTAPYDMEPLLIPRSLYLPWPSASVRALSEFFYTGQINGKWLLAPVALDLLVIAKLYEIPLLYTLIAEILYTILGRKEEGLFVNCTTLKNGLVKQVKELYGDDKVKIDSYLENSKSYNELSRLSEALIQIDNGFLNSSLLRRSSYNRSDGTHDSSDPEEVDKHFHRASSTGSFTNYRQSVISYGSKDSRGSLNAAGFPPSLNFQEKKSSISAINPRIKKKSSLSKEIDPQSYFQDGNFDIDKIKNRFRKDQSQDPLQGPANGSNEYDFGDYDLGFELSTSSSDDTSDDSGSDYGGPTNASIKGDMDRSKSNPELESLSTIVDARTNQTEETEDGLDASMKRLSISTPRSKAVKSLLNNYVDSGLGMSSLSRLKKKMKKAEEYSDDSVDPLFKINSTLQSPGRPQMGHGRISNQGSIYGGGGKTGFKSPKMSTMDKDYTVLRLECIIAGNALPPVDHIIKYIFKTAVLVNDVKMTIRCVDCLEISKDLKAVKKELSKDLKAVKKELSKEISLIKEELKLREESDEDNESAGIDSKLDASTKN